LSSTTTQVEGEDVLLGRLEQVSHPAAAPERGHVGREGLCLADVEIGRLAAATGIHTLQGLSPKRLMGFEPTTFCMARRTRGDSDGR
jgi:hypothetical protein